jgi:multiple sugar transport system substrate-binding protein
MVFGDPAELHAYQSLVAAYQQKYPGTVVQLIHIPSQSDYRTRLGMDLAAGKPADVLLINYRRYAAFAAKGALEPLGPYLEKSPLLASQDFFPQALDAFTFQGQLICIPQNISSLVVYFNKELFDQAGVAYPAPGWSWDDFLHTALALTKDLDGDGQIDQYGLGSEVSLQRFAPFIWQNGGILTGDPFNPDKLLLDNWASQQAIQWFVDLQVKHHVTPSAEQEAAESSENRFLNGRLGMYLNSRRGTPTYRESAAFDWDVAALPQKHQIASVLHSDAYCLPAVSTAKAQAWQFIEFANSAEGQAIVAASGRTVPSLRRVAESAAFLDPQAKPRSSRVFLEAIPTLRALPVMPTWVDIEEIADEEMERAFYGRASVAETIQAAISRSQIYFGPEP